MTPNLYDLLDVDQDASAEEIRAAWKSAIADLDPTDRRFRVYNDAAGVLLDAGKRAEYDAELATQRVDAEAAEEVDEPAPPSPAAAPATEASMAEPTGPPAWAIGAAALAALLALALALTLAFQPGGLFSGDDSPKEVAERNTRLERATVEAEAAAEGMVAPVLSYDYRTMAEDLGRIRGQMTEEMGEKQAKAWPDLTEEAQAQRLVVKASALGSAVTRVAPDGRRATVVVFLDQQADKRGAKPFVLKMWATFSLVRASGHDRRWLLDDLCTDSDCQ